MEKIVFKVKGETFVHPVSSGGAHYEATSENCLPLTEEGIDPAAEHRVEFLNALKEKGIKAYLYSDGSGGVYYHVLHSEKLEDLHKALKFFAKFFNVVVEVIGGYIKTNRTGICSAPGLPRGYEISKKIYYP